MGIKDREIQRQVNTGSPKRGSEVGGKKWARYTVKDIVSSKHGIDVYGDARSEGNTRELRAPNPCLEPVRRTFNVRDYLCQTAWRYQPDLVAPGDRAD